MPGLRRFLPDTIAGQITGLVIVAVLLGVGLAYGVLFYLVSQGSAGPDPEILATVRAARIAAIVKEAQTSRSPRELEQVLKRAHSSSMEVTPVSLVGLDVAASAAPRASPFVASVATMLTDNWGIAPLASASDARDERAIFVKVSDETALRFDVSQHGGLHNLVFIQTICALAIITFIILFLSIYAVRWITSPLSLIASAARSFGRTDAEDKDLGVDGPREIAQAAMALNEMRHRLRTLVNERTQMLVAISHDLRTPLTRLRLRAERLKDESLSASMLQDIVTINDMLRETLDYVRQGGQQEQVAATDLPSLLQTICAQFSDMGHEVRYQGAARFAFACRAHALGRALTNIVDNATKYADRVEVVLDVRDENSVHIAVSDDGPGIPSQLIGRAFEPFFKVDSSRSSDGRAGFGLGLSIARDIVERQGGAIHLSNRSPNGLVVDLELNAQPISRHWSVVSAA